MQPDETRRLLDELEAVTARLKDVEAALREQAERPARSGVRARLRAWSAARLGHLRQHAPKPLLVPSSYLRTDPPSPAPRISVVTPSFQQSQFLERTIYSVVSQGYPELEYVVQDGGSDDGTVDVLRRYEDRLAGWASEPDGGQATRSTAASRAPAARSWPTSTPTTCSSRGPSPTWRPTSRRIPRWTRCTATAC